MTEQSGLLSWRLWRGAAVLAALTMGGASFALVGRSSAAVTPVTGSAFGFSTNVSLFGGPFHPMGPAPKVKLPGGGSSVAITASAPSEKAQYGPATIFSSGKVSVSTKGTPGAAGSVSSSASLLHVSGGPFTADKVTSTCTAKQGQQSGSTGIVKGVLVTKTDASGNPLKSVKIPANPPPNDTFTGTINTVGDKFKYVFNEQVINPDGSITVNAAHDYLLGPTAKGDLIIGQSVCGAASTGSTTITGDQSSIVVAPGSSVLLTNANVAGAVIVQPGGSLDVENSIITGSITASSPGALRVCVSTIGGSINVAGAAGFVLIGDSGDDGCAPNTIGGSVTLSDNHHGVEMIGNSVAGAILATGNSGAGPFPEDVAPEIP
ncbi:MAG: hypothetical protein M3N98_11755 [Actinomycetota bacterium]|nr:hypothetical protein [Actinomycetota bacterium]